MVLESNVISRRRFACLFPVVIFLALRALSHAHPAPLPWTSGVYDGEGLDDILQTIRIAYAKSDDARHVTRETAVDPDRPRVGVGAFARQGAHPQQHPFARPPDLLSPAA